MRSLTATTLFALSLFSTACAQTQADRNQITQLVAGRIQSEFSNAAPGWASSRNCDTRSPDFYQCQYYVGLAGGLGPAPQTPRMFTGITVTIDSITASGSPATVLATVRANCLFATPSIVFGASESCDGGTQFSTRMVVTLARQMAGGWQITAIHEDQALAQQRETARANAIAATNRTAARLDATRKLLWAVYQSDINTARQLLDQGADPNMIAKAAGTNLPPAGSSDNNSLHVAITMGNLEMTRLLIEHGANINIPGFENATPVVESVKWLSVTNQTTAVLSLLISKGADVRAGDPIVYVRNCQKPVCRQAESLLSTAMLRPNPATAGQPADTRQPTPQIGVAQPLGMSPSDWLRTDAGSANVTWQKDGIRLFADRAVQSSISLRSKQTVTGSFEYVAEINHGGGGRTTLGVWSVTKQQWLAQIDLDTDDTAYLNFAAASGSTQYKYSSAPFMNRQVTFNVSVLGQQVSFAVDGRVMEVMQCEYDPGPKSFGIGVGSVPWKSAANTTVVRVISMTQK